MKIRLSQLRQIIRETIREQAVVPGHWDPRTGEPVSDEEIDTMGRGGLGLASGADEEHSADLEESKKKKGLWDRIHDRRKAGKRRLRPGEKGYPKTLDIDEGEDEIKNQ